MSILKVARMGHPVLRAKARRLEKADLESAAVQQLIDDMIDTMIEYRGVGLAAPQVHEGLRVFVAAIDPFSDEGESEDDAEPIAIVNPEITVVGGEVVDDWEGCLSIPDLRGRVPRAGRSRCARSTAAAAASSCAPTASRRASSSTKPITWTACCSSIGCARSIR